MIEDQPHETFSQALRRYRLAAGLSQEALAARAGLSARGISDLERGQRRSPHPETVRKLAQALGLDPQGLWAWWRPDDPTVITRVVQRYELDREAAAELLRGNREQWGSRTGLSYKLPPASGYPTTYKLCPDRRGLDGRTLKDRSA